MSLEIPNVIVAAVCAVYNPSAVGNRYSFRASAGIKASSQDGAFGLFMQLLEPVTVFESCVLAPAPIGYAAQPPGNNFFASFIVEKPNADPALQALPDNSWVINCTLDNGTVTPVSSMVFRIPAVD